MSNPRSTVLDEDITGNHPDESTLLDFSAGALGVAASDQVVLHLDQCSRCRQLLSMLTRSSTMLGDDEDEKGSPTKVGVDVLVGHKVGEYKVLERIAQGGMGVLYRGERLADHKPVAIKVLLPEIATDPNAVGRLLGEARAVSSVRHPNIVDVFALGQIEDGRHYMVMELLEGSSLSDVLKERGRLQPTEAHVVLEQAMNALVAAHAAGVIHRDLKPENIFVHPKPEGWRVTLLDFGLAKQQGKLSQHTAPNLVLGTPGFMAPEQIRGQATTPAIDIYAMGVVAWCMLTGREPYSGGSIVQVMKRHLEAPVPQLRTFIPGVPIPLEALVLQMMSKEPANRPTADEARKALVRLKNDARRFVQEGELTQLASPSSPLTVATGVPPIPVTYTAETQVAVPPPEDAKTHSGKTHSGLPPTVPEGVPPVPATKPPKPDRPMQPATTLPELPTVESATSISGPGITAPVELPFRRLPIVLGAIGLAFIGAAVGLIVFRPQPNVAVERPVEPVPGPGVADPIVPDPATDDTSAVVEVDPPRRLMSRAEVTRSVAAVRQKANGLSGPTKKQVTKELAKLDDRLRKNEAPAAVAKDLDKLVGQYELK